jgi:hypothetical protein
LTEHLISILVVFSMVGALSLLSSGSTFAQSNQSSQQQQAPPLPAPSVIPPKNNETSQGFGNVTDVQNLTGLNQAAMQNETGNQSAAGGQQQGNQTGNQSAAGGQQQGTQSGSQSAAGGQQQGTQSGSQSAAGGQQQGTQSGSGPLEQIWQAISNMFSGG